MNRITEQELTDICWQTFGDLGYVHVMTMRAICLAENPNLQVDAVLDNYLIGAISNPNSIYRYDRGIGQVNSVHGYDVDRLLSDPVYNLECCREIFNDRQRWDTNGFNAWSTFTSSSHLGGKMAAEVLGPTKFTPNAGLWGHGRVEGYPLTGDVSSPFGPRNSISTGAGTTGSFHTGIDIVAPVGTPIYAPCPFVVSFSGKDASGGQVVFGRCEDGTGIGFLHMEGLQLGAGHKARRGDIIGQVGMSGVTTGPHLHFMRLRQMVDGASFFDIRLFFDPAGNFVDTIASDSILVEPEVPAEQPDMLADFIASSLKALEANPPSDWGAAMRELQRRVDYLKGLLGAGG